MKIAIDIDNTICDTSLFFGNMAKEYDVNILHKNNIIDYSRVVPRSKDWTKEELDFFLENYFNKESINIPIKEDAVIYINKLKEKEFDIVFITNRGIKDGDNTDIITEEYLVKNNIPFDNIITKASDKYKYLDDCDYFIDDSIYNCEEALKNSKSKIILMGTTTNNNYNNNLIYRANNWKDLYNYIVNNDLINIKK